MRHIFNFITILTLSAFVAIGCVEDDAAFKDLDNSVGDNTFDPSSSGYLSFDSFAINVETIAEKFSDEKIDDVVATKSSESEDYSDYTVKITNESDGEVVYEDSYANTILLTEPMVLSAGDYSVEVYSCEESKIETAAWYAPEYAGSKSYTVGNENVTSVGEITCTLSNVMVSVTIAADVVSFFDPAPEDDDDRLQVLLECGEGDLTFYSTDEGKMGYFAAPADEKISIYLTGLYNQSSDPENPNYIKFEKGDWTEYITDVKAGQYRDIDIKIDYNSTGSMLIVVTITSWVYDDEIEVNATSSTFLLSVLSEEVIFDPDSEATNPNAPVITLDNGLDIADTYIINSDMYDTDSETYSPIYKAIITPEEGLTVESVEVSISSTSELLMSSLSVAGFDENNSITLYEGGALVASEFSSYISMRLDDWSDALFATIKYSGIVALGEMVGVHTLKVTATDSKGQKSYTTLTIESEAEGNEPLVVWLGGYDFDTRYEIFAKGYGDENNPTVELLMTSLSEEGLTSLSVTIVSDALSDDLLASAGLTKYIDLVNATETEAEALAELGLPVSSDIVGQQSVTVNISGLISLLAGVGDGESDFIMEVGDANGVTTRTVMVVKN